MWSVTLVDTQSEGGNLHVPCTTTRSGDGGFCVVAYWRGEQCNVDFEEEYIVCTCDINEKIERHLTIVVPRRYHTVSLANRYRQRVTCGGLTLKKCILYQGTALFRALSEPMNIMYIVPR